MAVGLGVTDLVLLIGSMAACALIGLYFSNKNKSIEAYMLGDRKLSVIPVAISLMTSCLSGLTLLGASAELYYQGPSYSFVIIPMLLSGPITAYTLLPIIYDLNELSLYEYLHKRFGLLVKYIVTIIFVLNMIFYNSVVLYLPSMALSAMLGVSRFYSILTIGTMCVLYSGVGGLKAVVWTDLFQAMLMYTSILIVVVLGTYDAGGPSRVIELAREQGRLELTGLFNWDLSTRHTIWAILIGSTLKHIYLVGANQVQIQRALSLPSLRQGQLAFVFCSLFGALIIALASYAGAVLVAAYRSCDPFLGGLVPRRDAIIVHYVATRLVELPGLRGLFVAGVFSATLSTLSSFANSMAALALEDLVKPLCSESSWLRRPQTSTKLAKLLATMFGLICVLMAYLIERASSRLLQATTTMMGALGVPFIGAFALGIFTRFVNTLGILAGFAVTLTLGAYISIAQTFFAKPLEPQMPVYYNDQCNAVFNLTLAPDQLPANIYISQWTSKHLHDLQMSEANGLEVGFRIDQISYMTLPAIQIVLMFAISSLVSLLTCGHKQQVSDHLLIPSLRISKSFTITRNSETAGAANGRKDLSIELERELRSKIKPLEMQEGRSEESGLAFTNKAFRQSLE